MSCSVCNSPVQLRIRHCDKCQFVTCGDVCRTVQTRLCTGEHVHMIDSWGTICLVAKCESDCEPAAILYTQPVLICQECHRVDCWCKGAL